MSCSPFLSEQRQSAGQSQGCSPYQQWCWQKAGAMGNFWKKTLHLSQDNWERKVYFSLGVSAVFWVVWDTWFSQLHESTKTFCKHFSHPCQQFNRKRLIPVLVIHINLCVHCLSNFLLCFS